MITNPAVYLKAASLSRIQSAISSSLVFNESAVWFRFVTSVLILLQGSYRQDSIKLKDFLRTSQILSYCFQGLKTKEKY